MNARTLAMMKPQRILSAGIASLTLCIGTLTDRRDANPDADFTTADASAAVTFINGPAFGSGPGALPRDIAPPVVRWLRLDAVPLDFGAFSITATAINGVATRTHGARRAIRAVPADFGGELRADAGALAGATVFYHPVTVRADDGASASTTGIVNHAGGLFLMTGTPAAGGTGSESPGARIAPPEGNRQLIGAGAITSLGGLARGTLSPQGGTVNFSAPIASSITGIPASGGTMNFSAGTSEVFGSIRMAGGVGGGERVVVSGGGTATFHDRFIHNGAEVRAGEGSTIVFSGALSGAGSLTGSGTVALAGSYNPGNSPAIVNISVNFTYSSGSLQIMEIFGLLPGPGHPGPEDGHDQLIFTGSGTGTPPQVRWDGTLRIDLGNNFMPQLGMTFNLFDFDNTRDAGAFHTLTVSDPGGLLLPTLAFDYSQLYVNGTVSIVPIPEPAGALLLALGGASLALRRRPRMGEKGARLSFP